MHNKAKRQAIVILLLVFSTELGAQTAVLDRLSLSETEVDKHSKAVLSLFRTYHFLVNFIFSLINNELFNFSLILSIDNPFF